MYCAISGQRKKGLRLCRRKTWDLEVIRYVDCQRVQIEDIGDILNSIFIYVSIPIQCSLLKDMDNTHIMPH